MKKRYFLILSIIFLLTFSCKKTETPAYLFISVEDFKVNTDNFNKDHGTEFDKGKLEALKEHNFRDVLVSLNGKELGYWQLPCTIPLLPDYSKENNIRVIPCTRLTYLTLKTQPYYFLSPQERFLTIEKEGVYSLKDLSFEYVKNITFHKFETFEEYTDFKPHPKDSSKVTMEIINSKGKISLEDTVAYFNVVTSPVVLEKGNRYYWEMDYYCDNGDMSTYLDVQSSSTILPQQNLIEFPATDSWKKVYIDLSEVVIWVAGDAPKISVSLGIRGLKKSDANAYFYFDNIKLISMPAPY